MQKAEGPGDTPEWKARLSAMHPIARARFALAIGVTARTVANWMNGSTHPTEATVERVEKQLRKKG